MTDFELAIKKVAEAVELLEKVGKEQFGFKNEPLKVEKIAVKVSNLREANIVAKRIGSLYFDGVVVGVYIGKEPCVVYLDKPFSEHADYGTLDCLYEGYNVVEFEFWAAQNGLTPPKFIMKSEDGVDLYEGDHFQMVKNIPATGNKWEICIKDAIMTPDSFAITDPECCKAFNSKEAAEKWIEEKNKPKEIEIKMLNPNHTAVVSNNFIHLHGKNIRFSFTSIDLEKIYEAFKSLQK